MLVHTEWSGSYHGRVEKTNFKFNGGLDITEGNKDEHHAFTNITVNVAIPILYLNVQLPHIS